MVGETETREGERKRDRRLNALLSSATLLAVATAVVLDVADAHLGAGRSSACPSVENSIARHWDTAKSVTSARAFCWDF